MWISRRSLQGRLLTACIAGFALLCGSGLLAAEDAEDAKEESETKESPAITIPGPVKIEVGVQIRFRNEWRDNLDFQPADDADYFLGQRIRGHVKIKFNPYVSFYVQGQDVWLYGAERDKIIHDFGTNLHQAYFDLNFSPLPAEVRVGRQEFNYGRQRLVGGFGWDNVGRSFDGARARFQRGSWTGDVLWGRVVDIRRRGRRRRSGHLDLSGVHITRAPKDSGKRTEVYGWFLRDGLQTAGELGRPLENTGIFTVGLRRVSAPKTGFRYEFENAWQFGERGPDSHNSVMLVANTGHVWDKFWKPLLQAEYAFARGDNDPADGNSNEFHNLFPTNHLHYGYADLAGLRNIHNLRLTAAAQVAPKVRVEVDYHNLWLAAKRGAWKNAGGAVLGVDPAGQSGRHIGQEVDFTLRLPLLKYVSFMAGYAAFFPGTFAKNTRGSETHQWGFVQTVVQF